MTLSERLISPDERCFHEHIQGGRFRLGVEDGKWRLVSTHLVDWPKRIFAVRAAPRENAPTEYIFRFDLEKYPNQAPTAQPWDADHEGPLPHGKWPRGSDNSRVAQVFRPEWNDTALYLPCDRIAIPGHPNWLSQHRRYLWSADKDISFFLSILYDLLNSPNYQGTRST